MDQVTLAVDGGPTIAVPWTSGMNAQQVLEAAFQQQQTPGSFAYGLQYFGSPEGQYLGYLVLMINETYDTFISSGDPYFYWQFSVDGIPAPKGVDSTIVDNGATVGFAYTQWAEDQEGTALEIKHRFRSSL